MLRQCYFYVNKFNIPVTPVNGYPKNLTLEDFLTDFTTLHQP